MTTGYTGPWIENTFRDHFVRQFKAEGDIGIRLYLPIMWFDCHFGCSKMQQEDLKGTCMYCAEAWNCIVELPVSFCATGTPGQCCSARRGVAAAA